MKSEKELQRAKIEADTRRFLDAGGEIRQVGQHVMGEEKIQFVRLPGNMERVSYVSGKKGSLA